MQRSLRITTYRNACIKPGEELTFNWQIIKKTPHEITRFSLTMEIKILQKTTFFFLLFPLKLSSGALSWQNDNNKDKRKKKAQQLKKQWPDYSYRCISCLEGTKRCNTDVPIQWDAWTWAVTNALLVQSCTDSPYSLLQRFLKNES